jgi:hypothetical protein
MSLPPLLDFEFAEVRELTHITVHRTHKGPATDLFIRAKISLHSFETGSHYAAQAGLKLEPQPSECWDYRCAPPHPAFIYTLNSFVSVTVTLSSSCQERSEGNMIKC